MEITWYGHSCFRMLDRGRASIVTDPYDDSLGYPVPRLKADIVTISHDEPEHNHVKAVKGYKHLIDGPGEYEIGGVFVTAVATHTPRKKGSRAKIRRNLLSVFDFNSVTVCHLGDLDHIPAQSQIESLGTIDIALTPVGGGGALNSAQAAEVVSLLEPSIVVPMHYKLPGTTLKLDAVDKFLKEMGISDVAEESSLKVNSRSGLPDQTAIVLLEFVEQS